MKPHKNLERGILVNYIRFTTARCFSNKTKRQNGGKEARQKAERTPRNSRNPSKDGTIPRKKRSPSKGGNFSRKRRVSKQKAKAGRMLTWRFHLFGPFLFSLAFSLPGLIFAALLQGVDTRQQTKIIPSPVRQNPCSLLKIIAL
jgi:hypothetical protein